MSRVRDENLYGRWNMMKQRCFNPNNNKYPLYGGRGIKVCNDWMDYQTFKKWSIENGFEEHLTIDRINNDGNYEPHNCRWACQKEQQNNRSNNRILIYEDKKYTLAELSEKHGMDADTISRRLSTGMTVSESINTPLNNHYVIKGSESPSLRKECIKRSLNYKAVHARIKRGWSVERALNTPIRKGNYKTNV